MPADQCPGPLSLANDGPDYGRSLNYVSDELAGSNASKPNVLAPGRIGSASDIPRDSSAGDISDPYKVYFNTCRQSQYPSLMRDVGLMPFNTRACTCPHVSSSSFFTYSEKSTFAVLWIGGHFERDSKVKTAQIKSVYIKHSQKGLGRRKSCKQVESPSQGLVCRIV